MSLLSLFYPPKPWELRLQQEPSLVHRINDDPDEEIVQSAYERKLEMMRKRYRDRKAGIPGMTKAQIAQASAEANKKRRAQQVNA